MEKTHIPLAAMEHVFEALEAARISDGAKRTLRKACEKEGRKIAELALRLARHAGRTTVRIEDVELAIEQLR
jgi:histone H3/H4